MPTSLLGPGVRGFGSIVWNINLSGPGATWDQTRPGWQPDVSFTDTNRSAVLGGVPLWSTNTDSGVPGDLQNIVQSIAKVPNPTPLIIGRLSGRAPRDNQRLVHPLQTT